MMTLHELVSWLETHKGTGEWEKLAEAAGVPYNTIARIARGYIKSPGVLLVEKLSNAVRAMEAADKAAA